MLLKLVNNFNNKASLIVSSLTSRFILNSPQQLTLNWAQSLINFHHNPQLKPPQVHGVEIVSLDVGTTTRIRLKLEHDAEGILPKRWFIKLPSLSLRAKAITTLPRLLPTEIRFYNELADLIPLTIPKTIAGLSRFGRGSTLVMSDVSEYGAIPGKAGDALDSAQALLVAEKLALFHAAFMEKAKQDRSLRWLAGPVRRLEDFLGSALAVPLMKRGLRLSEYNIPPDLHQPALHYARYRKQMMRYLSTPEPTLLHHDCHPGNLFWHNGQPGFLDWQMVRIGEGVSDLSYFMATALLPETRRGCEVEVLQHYLETMRSNSSFKSGFKPLYNRYRVHLAYPFEAMTLSLAVGGLMQLESNLEMIRRSAAAAADHDTFDLLTRSVSRK